MTTTTERPFHRIALTLATLLVLCLTLAAAPAHADTRSGRFEGASGHVTRGGAVVEVGGNGATVRLASDFTFDGAPDPKLAFGNHNTIDQATIFSPLRQNTGAQTYRVPSNVDPSRFTYLYLWCERFNVPLGRARLSSR